MVPLRKFLAAGSSQGVGRPRRAFRGSAVSRALCPRKSMFLGVGTQEPQVPKVRGLPGERGSKGRLAPGKPPLPCDKRS